MKSSFESATKSVSDFVALWKCNKISKGFVAFPTCNKISKENCCKSLAYTKLELTSRKGYQTECIHLLFRTHLLFSHPGAGLGAKNYLFTSRDSTPPPWKWAKEAKIFTRYARHDTYICIDFWGKNYMNLSPCTTFKWFLKKQWLKMCLILPP